jgi:regulator of sirC expression with transglutaminase-like and TPR domain
MTIASSITAPAVSAPRRRFADLVGCRGGELDLAAAALAISAEENPELDPAPCLAELDALAAEVAPRLAGLGSAASDEVARLDTLRRFLFVEKGFHGNRDDYYDPANSLLDRVLARRTGIPITLAIVVLEVGRRVGVPLVGVAFPGHFLVRHAHHPRVLLDPFAGRFITHRGCREILACVGGGAIPFHPRLLAPVSGRCILLRLLNNLRAVYGSRGEVERTLAILDRMLLLAPDNAVHLRERGLLHLHRGDLSRALDDLGRYLAVEPEAPDRDAVESLLAVGEQRMSVVH